ncbi:MAG: hypothetical protein QGG40_17860, partial [Myxococcota bacterium]|nr:hypothetical protein [Myxococcota bacterium]
EESYELQVPPGQTPVWTLAGPIPVDDLTAGFSDTSSALALLQQHSDRLWWGWDPGVELDAMELGEVSVSPELSLDEQILVHVGEISTGFSGEEQVLVLLGELYDQHGWIVSGFGVGTTSVAVDRVEDSTIGSSEQEVVAVAQVGGLGDGGGLCLSRADVTGSEITTPSLMEVSQVVSFDGSTREYEISTDDRAQIVRVRIYGGSDSVRELLHAGGNLTGILPAPGFTFGHGQTDWTLIAYETQTGTFESLATQGSNTNEDLANRSQAISRIHSEF